MRFHRRTFVILTLLITRVYSATTCYRPDGNAQEDAEGSWNSSNGFAANVCNPDAEVSACCSSADRCLSNGLCLDMGSDNALSIQGCTSQGWPEPCLTVCDVAAGNGKPNLGVCPDNLATNGYTSFFCASHTNGSDDCANLDSQYVVTLTTGQLQLREADIPSSLVATVTAPNSISTTTDAKLTRTTTVSGAIVTITSGSSTMLGSSDGRIIGFGIGFGGLLPLLLLLALAVWMLMRRTRELRQLRLEKSDLEGWRQKQAHALIPGVEQPKDVRYELDNGRPVQELL